MNQEDSSNDVVAINSDDGEEEASGKPIIQLFKRLITSNCKQNTVLTNAQIVDILNKEFGINISDLHELEGDIYLTIMKKYLKEWPQWDEFDRIVNDLKSDNKKDEMERIFESKYVHLKNYLKSTLDVAQKLAKVYVQKVIAFKNNLDKSSDSGVVLEIQASRNQLNQLFFRRPNPLLESTIFNPTYSIPTQIQLTTLPLEAILNWWGVNITIVNSAKISNATLYKREMKHELKHILVNKKLTAPRKPLTVLDQVIQSTNLVITRTMDMSLFIKNIDKLAFNTDENSEIYDFIKKDLKMFPNRLPSRKLLKRYTNKYPYKRYLYTDFKDVGFNFGDKYDLQLEETLSPCYQTFIGVIHESTTTLNVFCVPCNVNFTGRHLVQELKAHFDEHHQNEPDWKCVNCERNFSMVNLAQNWWCHRC